MLISYYLIKPLRNSQFLKEFDASFLPVIYLGVAVLCFAITKLFNLLADRVDKYRLVGGAYLAMMVIKLGFGVALAHPGKVAVVAFYFFASAYFALALAAMWACINDIFVPEQAERCYGFIAVGSTLGGMLGSGLSKQLSDSRWSDYPAQASALSMGLALILLMWASAGRRRERADLPASAPSADPKAPGSADFWGDVRELLRRPYVRRIGMMVFLLAVFNTGVLDFSSNRAIDVGVSREQFHRVFTYLPTEKFSDVHAIKRQSSKERSAEFERLAQLSGQTSNRLKADYELYQDECEKRVRSVFSDVYFFQGLVGILLVMVVARFLFRSVGVRYAAVAMPIVAATAAIAFSFSLDIFVVEVIAVVVGSMNYSLNNATKELLYTATDEETKFKYKPMIEGPFMRFGDASASLLALALASLAAFLGLPETVGQYTLLFVVLGLVIVWARAAYLAGQEFDDLRRKEDRV